MEKEQKPIICEVCPICKENMKIENSNIEEGSYYTDKAIVKLQIFWLCDKLFPDKHIVSFNKSYAIVLKDV